MKKPRCGMRDPIGDNRRRRYVTYSKWRKTHLTYYVQPGEDLTSDQQKEIFANALKFWADVSAMTFSEVSSARNADIKIR
ncbi:stromelysin-3-like isoform X2 [Oculina patagonica]